MAKLGWPEEVFYRRLHSVVDDFGRYYADEGLLRAACYPRQLNKVSDSDVGKWLRACEAAALVRVYSAQDGERYLMVLDFNQQVRAKKSRFPEMPSACVADAAQTIGASAADAHLGVFGGVSVSVIPSPNGEGVGEGADQRHLRVVKSLNCPHERLIALYHEVLPTCRQVREWNETRQGYLRSRWREKAAELAWQTEDEGVEWFRSFFGYCATSKFLTGRIAAGNGRKPFLADLEWLMKPDNFAKAIEGKYE